MKIIKGDTVKIILGEEKGRTGKVIRVFKKTGLVIVDGLNKFKKHLKPTGSGQAGKIIEKEKPIKVSKLVLICPSCQKATKVAYQLDKSGAKYRLCRLCHSIIKNGQ